MKCVITNMKGFKVIFPCNKNIFKKIEKELPEISISDYCYHASITRQEFQKELFFEIIKIIDEHSTQAEKQKIEIFLSEESFFEKKLPEFPEITTKRSFHISCGINFDMKLKNDFYFFLPDKQINLLYNKDIFEKHMFKKLLKNEVFKFVFFYNISEPEKNPVFSFLKKRKCIIFIENNMKLTEITSDHISLSSKYAI